MTVTAPRRAYAEPAPAIAVPAPGLEPPPAAAPPCPVCDSPMALRNTSADGRASTWFWGCSRFPACRGMLSAPQPAPAPLAEPLPVAARPAPPRRAKPRVIRTFALVVLVTTLVAMVLIGSVPALLGR